ARVCLLRVRVGRRSTVDTCSCCLFFFFQAEDGIRDRNVTGVQTCALPISPTSKLLLIFISLTFTYSDSLSGCMMTHSGTGKYFFKYCMIFLFGNFKLPTEMDFCSSTKSPLSCTTGSK